MGDREPPVWGDDRLSTFFRDAEINTRVTMAKYPDVYRLLQRLDQAFWTVADTFEHDNAQLVPRFLFVRAYSAYLAACRLGMSGQLMEARPVLRLGLECAWYALHVAADPAPYQRAEVWLQRNDNAEAAKRCRKEFTVTNVRATHETRDAETAADVRRLYDELIDLGAHPNQLGTLAAARCIQERERVGFDMGILYAEELPVMFTLRQAVAVGVGALKICRLVYAERFAIVGLDGKIDALVGQLNTVFRRYGRLGQ